MDNAAPPRKPVRVRCAFAIVFLALLTFFAAEQASAEDDPSLVSVTFNDQSIPAATQMFGAPQTYAFCSSDGQPIRLTITNRAKDWEGELELRSADGSVITTQFLRPGKHELALKVPASGLYFLQYDNGRYFWQIFLPENTVAVLCLEPGKPLLHSGCFYRRYFYVPMGTTQIGLRVATGHAAYTVKIVNPDGVVEKTITEADPGGEFSIPVPSGLDGQVWMFDGLGIAPTYLSFMNIPNYMAAAPNALLLPADLVKKDGL